MSNLKKHAMAEFRAAGWLDENGNYNDEMQEAICNHVIDLLKVFSDEGHSGTTAPYTVDLFSKLAKFEPIVPLTGEYWEWNEIADERVTNKVYQNKRCSAVFKQADMFNGLPYYLDGKVFWEWYKNDEGEVFKNYYTSGESSVQIKFPYTPKTEYVFVPTEQFPNEHLTDAGE